MFENLALFIDFFFNLLASVNYLNDFIDFIWFLLQLYEPMRGVELPQTRTAIFNTYCTEAHTTHPHNIDARLHVRGNFMKL